MTIAPLLTFLLAIPVLLMGEQLVRRVRWLERTNIPAPVVGGLLVALLILVVNLTVAAKSKLSFGLNVDAPWWTWLVTIEPEWAARPVKSLSVPMLGAFYVCAGLNCTWAVVRKGGVQVVIFLAAATLLGVVQNIVGIAIAKGMGLPSVMGVVCGSLTMAGGHGTAQAFVPQLVEAGLKEAALIGSAMATMGLVVGSLMGGPVGGWLIRHYRLKAELVPAPATGELRQDAPAAAAPQWGLGFDLRTLWFLGGTVLKHLLIVLALVKLGAWASYYLKQITTVTFPVHIGAMLLATLVRNLADLVAPGWIRTEVVAPIGSVFLALFLSIAMIGLNLAELVNAAVPMLVILAAQVVVMAFFAVWITFRALGRDYEAAQMAAGHCGFGIGNTANAVASMKTLVEKYGPAPRAFLVIPLVGGLLGDLTNGVNISMFLKWLGAG
jgi:ESS family glutamate:Na+ symporter